MEDGNIVYLCRTIPGWEMALEHRITLPEWRYLLSYDNANVPL